MLYASRTLFVMMTLLSSIFTKKYAITFTGLVVILISLSVFINSSQNNPIVGTWIVVDATSTQNKTVFTADHKVKYFHKGTLMATKDYKISSIPSTAAWICQTDCSDIQRIVFS